MIVDLIVDLFAGPGGLDMAARGLGVPVIGLEWDADACATRRAAGLPTVEGDVTKFGPADFPEADVLAGGPPCQTYSAAGSGAGRAQLDLVLDLVRRMGARESVTRALAGLSDPRTALALEPLRWTLAALDSGRPYRAVVLEQVPQVLPVWEAYAEVLRAEGYGVAAGVLRAEEHGAPQTRRRAVLIARHGLPAALPEPTHRRYLKGVPQVAGDPALLPWVSQDDVLHIGPFEAVSNYGTGGDPRARGRRTHEEPAATVTGKISRVRLVRDGSDLPRLTPGQAGLLQGFPPDYPWRGADISQQIGNAVPVALGRAVLAAALGLGPVACNEIRRCVAPGCAKPIVPRAGRGRPARHCSGACRVRAHRAAKAVA
ncbi:DNA cytosine methyltransferase [Streptomyces laurentii]|uniref:DNA cytosine methyltransferase n=1 Tax=Streptomyces laurentii TaxID=39478 RepID=UPI0036BB1528